MPTRIHLWIKQAIESASTKQCSHTGNIGQEFYPKCFAYRWGSFNFYQELFILKENRQTGLLTRIKLEVTSGSWVPWFCAFLVYMFSSFINLIIGRMHCLKSCTCKLPVRGPSCSKLCDKLPIGLKDEYTAGFVVHGDDVSIAIHSHAFGTHKTTRTNLTLEGGEPKDRIFAEHAAESACVLSYTIHKVYSTQCLLLVFELATICWTKVLLRHLLNGFWLNRKRTVHAVTPPDVSMCKGLR